MTQCLLAHYFRGVAYCWICIAIIIVFHRNQLRTVDSGLWEILEILLYITNRLLFIIAIVFVMLLLRNWTLSVVLIKTFSDALLCLSVCWNSLISSFICFNFYYLFVFFLATGLFKKHIILYLQKWNWYWFQCDD